MSEIFDVFNSRDDIYLVFTAKKLIFFLFYTFFLKIYGYSTNHASSPTTII